MFGYSYDEALKLNVNDISQGENPYSQEEAEKLLKKAAEEGYQFFQWQCKRKNGELFWAEVSLKFATISGQKRVLAFDRDITERKRIEELSGMLMNTIERHYDGAYWLDRENKFVYANNAGCKVLGYSREELIGRHISEVNPKATTEALNLVWERLHKDESFSIETVHRRKDGSEFPVEIV